MVPSAQADGQAGFARFFETLLDPDTRYLLSWRVQNPAERGYIADVWIA
jgi:hypothetical protein